MKTIVFYSYKGGVGKTLTAANLAVLLSRLNRNSVLLDFDFEGPSLHTKFEPARQSIPGASPRGFLGYFHKHVQAVNRAEHYPLKFNTRSEMEAFVKTILDSDSGDEAVRFVDPLPLQKTEEKDAQYFEAVRTLDPIRDAGLHGTIHLIPAGDTGTKEYWPVAMGWVFRRVTGFEYDRDRLAEPTASQFYENARSFFKGVKERIANLHPKPHYLIVDTKAGSHEIATSVISHWADILVCMFGNNDESVQYLKSFLPKFRKAKRISLVPVLSRVPMGYHYHGNSKRKQLLESINLQEKDLAIVYSDPEMEIEERLVFGYDNPIVNCQLTRDYLQLFGTILGVAGESEFASAQTIIKEIQVDWPARNEVKRFTLKPDEGLLINPNDGSRNVSFKQQTFQLLLDGLAQGLSWESYSEALCNAGQECGFRFGKALSSGWGGTERFQDEKYRGVQAEIQDWCEFDSDVGLGRFRLELTDDASHSFGGRSVQFCKIKVLNSFLVPVEESLPSDSPASEPSNKPPHRHCRFMEGYISGVFRALFGAEYVVEHTADSKPGNCVFRITKKTESSQFAS